MNQREIDKELNEKIRQKLDDDLTNIDFDIQQRLAVARKTAASYASKTHTTQHDASLISSFPQWLAPVSNITAFATIAIVALLILVKPGFHVQQTDLFIEDIALLSSHDEPEMYSDLAFLIWIDDE